MEYYSAIKRKEVQIPATMWKDPRKVMMLSERSQTQKSEQNLIPLTEGP